MSVQIEQYYTQSFLRNFIYFIKTDEQIICIDPVDAKSVEEALGDEITKLKIIINTHEHHDHIGGNKELHKKYGVEVWAHENGRDKIPCVTKFLKHKDIIELDENHYIEVLDTPGHTFAHLCFLFFKDGKPHSVFTGDTLFNAGVGHCRLGGDPEVLYETVFNQIRNLPEEILVYPGHEYLINNIKFTLDREPQNSKAKKLLEKYEPQGDGLGFVSTLKIEKEINTFLRCDNPLIGRDLSLKKVDTKQVFLKLRELRNRW